MRGHAIGQRQQTHHVLQQPAQPRVMKLPRGRRLAIGLRHRGIVEQRLEQPLQVGIGQALDARLKLRPQCAHVASRRGQHVRLVGLALERLAQLIDLHLRAVLIAGKAAPHLDDVAALKVLRDTRVARIPHASLDLAAFVAQNQVQIRLVRLCSPLLLGQDEKETVEELSLVKAQEIADIDVFHSAEKINANGP